MFYNRGEVLSDQFDHFKFVSILDNSKFGHQVAPLAWFEKLGTSIVGKSVFASGSLFFEAEFS